MPDLQSQFGQIKLLYLLQNKCEWKKIRNQNHGAIIGFMEQNLELLQRVSPPDLLNASASPI